MNSADHERALKELRQSEERYRQLVERLPAITYIAEPGEAGRWHFVSPQVKNILGYSVEEWLANPRIWYDRILEEDQAQVLQHENEIIEGKEPLIYEYRIRAKDNRLIWIHDEAVLCNNGGQGPLLIHGFMIDVTEQKKTKEALKQKEEQLIQAYKMEAIGRLAGGIAHDFNNLLTSIMGFSHLVMDDLDKDSPIRRNLSEIVYATELACNLTQRLLSFGRRQTPQIRLININRIVEDMYELLRRTLGEDIELVAELEDNMGPIEVDAGQMSQVILNLGINARDAMPRGGRLYIQTACVSFSENSPEKSKACPPGEYVRLSVKDTGTGMSDEVRQHIFEPFFTTKEHGKGTGLGLATVLNIVQQNKGYIDFDTKVGQGTNFHVYLPCRTGEVEADTPTAPSELPRGCETILLVEDEDVVRRLTVKMLESIGYHVVEARNGEEAFTLLTQKNAPAIDLIVTDVVMPKLNGPDLIGRLREHHISHKVIYISGFTDGKVQKAGLSEEDPLIIMKPFTRKTLAYKIRDVIDQP